MQIAQSLQNIQPSYIREILRVANAPDMISLAGGLPDPNYFPLALMQSSIQHLTDKPELFQYANTQGYEPLLEFLMDYYQLTQEQSALICTGSQQALDLIARAFINSADNVVVEEPSYLGALQVFGLAQANMIGVLQNDQGPDVVQLEQLFTNQNIKLFYAVPDFHNPTGVCWSLATRQKVAALCIQYSVTLIEDVPYRELRFSGDALPLVSSFCPEQAFVLRSFSKIATPGVRLGLVYGPKIWMAALSKIKQAADLHSSVPMQSVLLALLQHPKFSSHLDNLRCVYANRYEHLAALIKDKLGDRCQFKTIQGGMFLWVTLTDINTDLLAKLALENGVAVVPSSVFYQTDTAAQSTQAALRLNFSHTNEAQLDVAVNCLSQVINQVYYDSDC